MGKSTCFYRLKIQFCLFVLVEVMSINRSTGPGISFWDGEMVVQDHDNVQMSLKKNTHSTEHLKGVKLGKVYLTNYRMVFRTKSTKDMMQELSMPFKQIKDFEIKQPVFGANYIYGPGGREQTHFYATQPNQTVYPPVHPIPPPAYQQPQQPYPPAYAGHPQPPQQGGSTLPPEYDPYQTPPAYKK